MSRLPTPNSPLPTTKPPLKPVDVRRGLVDALRLDLVGPGEVLGPEGTVLGDVREILSQRPSTWYLTGFLVPLEAEASQRADEQSADELDEVSDSEGTDDAAAPEPAAAKVRYLPSSVGLSVLVPGEATELTVTVRWGDYKALQAKEAEPSPFVWERTAREETVVVALPERTDQPQEQPVPKSAGLALAVAVRPVPTESFEGMLPAGTRSVSVFLVNRRTPKPDEWRDEAFAFQVQLELHGERPFVPRPDLRSLASYDWDDRVADLQYRDAFEYAVGHSVATEAIAGEDRQCWMVRTCWIPQAEVERVAPAAIEGVELSMDALGQLADGNEARAKLMGFVTQYRQWIAGQRAVLASLSSRRARRPRNCSTGPPWRPTGSSGESGSYRIRRCLRRFASPTAPWPRRPGAAWE